MNILLIILAIAAALFGYYFIYPHIKRTNRFKGIWRSLDAYGIPKHFAKFTVEVKTPKGAHIDSINEVPAKALAIVDAALEELFVVTHRDWPEWDKAFTIPEHNLLFIQPAGFTVETLPLGTPYIQLAGGTTAGTCIGTKGMSAADKPYIVVPDFSSVGWDDKYMDALYQAIFNEGQHRLEYANNDIVGDYFTGWQDVHRHDYTEIKRILSQIQ